MERGWAFEENTAGSGSWQRRFNPVAAACSLSRGELRGRGPLETIRKTEAPPACLTPQTHPCPTPGRESLEDLSLAPCWSCQAHQPDGSQRTMWPRAVDVASAQRQIWGSWLSRDLCQRKKGRRGAGDSTQPKWKRNGHASGKRAMPAWGWPPCVSACHSDTALLLAELRWSPEVCYERPPPPRTLRCAGTQAPPAVTQALATPAPKPAAAASLLGSLGSAPTNCVFPGWPPRSRPWGCFPPVAVLCLRFSKSCSGDCSVDSGRMALSSSRVWAPALPALEFLGPTRSAMLGPHWVTEELSPCPRREPVFAFDQHMNRVRAGLRVLTSLPWGLRPVVYSCCIFHELVFSYLCAFLLRGPPGSKRWLRRRWVFSWPHPELVPAARARGISQRLWKPILCWHETEGLSYLFLRATSEWGS